MIQGEADTLVTEGESGTLTPAVRRVQERPSPTALNAEVGSAPPTSRALNLLSAAERTVLSGIIQGKPNEAIASELNMATEAVVLLRSDLMSKLRSHYAAWLRPTRPERE